MEHSSRGSFIAMCRALKGSHFMRKRKMPLDKLILTVLFRKGRTLIMELRSFKKILFLKDKISKTGYLKQRMKLNPEAFLELARFHASNFYKDTEMVKKRNGYLILAADGSAINVPTTEENVKLYGNASRKNVKPQAQIGLSCLYDTVNKMIIDGSINRWKFDERKQALAHIDNISEVVGHHPCVFVFDRGYPSGELFIELIERQTKFLVRLGLTSFKKEQNQMDDDDCMVEIVFDRTRINPHRGTPIADKLEKTGSIVLRFVRIRLQNGGNEYLATNLSPDKFSTEEIGVLYSMRWEIETVYDDLKNKLCIENFTGTKPILLEQDIFATVYLCNVMNDMALEAQMELEADESNRQKYVMAINKNIAIGIMKEELISFILEKDRKKREELMKSIIDEIKQNLLPVRKGRHYPRTRGQLVGNYSNNHP
ncbi:MAG: IS4 family transposase [Bacillota bacterium]